MLCVRVCSSYRLIIYFLNNFINQLQLYIFILQNLDLFFIFLYLFKMKYFLIIRAPISLEITLNTNKSMFVPTLQKFQHILFCMHNRRPSSDRSSVHVRKLCSMHIVMMYTMYK